MLSEAGFQNLIVTPTKHAVASLVGIVMFTVACCGVYFLLLVWAVLTKQTLGSPILPLLVPVLAVIVSGIYAFFILTPIVAATEWMCATVFRWPLWTQPPFAVVLLWLFLMLVAAASDTDGSLSARGVVLAASIGTGLLAIPLGLHWWCVQAGNVLAWLVRRLIGRRHAYPSPTA